MVKIVLAGDGAVGKTSVRQRYIGKEFKENYMMTIGANFITKKIEVPEGHNFVKAQIWDLAGQPSFQEVREKYYKGSHGAIIVFDITRKSSFENIHNWIKEIGRQITTPILPVVLFGNKIDLLKDPNEMVSKEEIAEMQQIISELLGEGRLEVPFIFTSAKTNKNIDHGFKLALEKIIEAWGD